MSTLSPSEAFLHQPVMLKEICQTLEPAPSGVILDATLGGAGHASALLEQRPDWTLLGLDRDAVALKAAAERLAPMAERTTLHQATFAELDSVMDQLGITELSGFLFDLGVSSPQLDHADRGFSFRHCGPLDMRMDRRQDLTAHKIVNEYPADQLSQVLYRYGDERFSRQIAAAIVSNRPLEDTATLADVIKEAIPAAARRKGGHPAKRTFQALRIEVNGELAQIEPALQTAIKRLRPGGRGAVLSYHSGEDRLVKKTFVNASIGGCQCPAQLPCGCGAQPLVRLLRRGSVTPTESEKQVNRRAASARLRTIERLKMKEVIQHDGN